jgi:hypothetical protein
VGNRRVKFDMCIDGTYYVHLLIMIGLERFGITTLEACGEYLEFGALSQLMWDNLRRVDTLVGPKKKER